MICEDCKKETIIVCGCGYCGSAGHVSQESVRRYIQEQEGKKPFEYDIYECPKELKGQLRIGDFYG